MSSSRQGTCNQILVQIPTESTTLKFLVIVDCIILSLFFQAVSKRKREFDPHDVSRGTARARQFLQDFTQLPLDKMDLKQALQQLSQMKTDLEKNAVDSQWLQQFFSSSD